MKKGLLLLCISFVSCTQTHNWVFYELFLKKRYAKTSFFSKASCQESQTEENTDKVVIDPEVERLIEEQEEQDAYLLNWNVDQINRARKAYQAGFVSEAEVESAVDQAYRALQEKRAQESWVVWLDEYHPEILYVGCGFIGAAAMWLWQS